MFADDGRWYRARVLGQKGTSDSYNVQFIDYGNQDVVQGKFLKKVPAKLLTIPDQARESGFAYVRVPTFDHEVGEKAWEEVKGLIWEMKLEAHYVYEEERIAYCLLYPVGKTDAANSIQARLIEKGFARIDPSREIPQEFETAWRKLEDKAKVAGAGIWGFEDVLSDAEEVNEAD
eukprot:TRINITY_DN263_c0_g1_i2.p1 TRINITY_DN263_c0_g1~~TRINITY_DN263_c0_g1_i2.p1  ORF type:complete len:175 (-),score=60.09 TRINITY_DN263_c0_g1_i2:95-619(-)